VGFREGYVNGRLFIHFRVVSGPRLSARWKPGAFREDPTPKWRYKGLASNRSISILYVLVEYTAVFNLPLYEWPTITLSSGIPFNAGVFVPDCWMVGLFHQQSSAWSTQPGRPPRLAVNVGIHQAPSAARK